MNGFHDKVYGICDGDDVCEGYLKGVDNWRDDDDDVCLTNIWVIKLHKLTRYMT